MKSRKHTARSRAAAWVLLLTVAAVIAAGCAGVPAAPPEELSVAEDAVIEIGTGGATFRLDVIPADGAPTRYRVSTDRETVGDALADVGLIAGEEGPYGLEVKTVAGVTVDFAADGKYWAFYINGTYASSGVDTTPVTPDAVYTFRVE